MADEQLSVQSATGVDLTLSVAGPGSRSYAFVIDWHIRLLTALAWFLCTALLINGRIALRGLAPSKTYVFVALLPAIAAGGGGLSLLVEPAAGIAPLYRLIESARHSVQMTMYELDDQAAEQDGDG